VMDVAWTEQGFALAASYDATSGDFAGLTLPLDDDLPVISDDTYLVAPHVATAQRAREQVAKAAAGAASQTAPESPAIVTTTDPTISPSRPSTSEVSVVARGRYEGRYEVDPSQPDAIAGRLREVVEEVVRHIVAAKGAENVSIVLEVSAENAEGFSEAVARTVRENSKVLGFDLSEFEDVEW